MPRPSSARRQSEIARQKQQAAAEARARRDRRRRQLLAGAVVVVVVISTIGAFIGAKSTNSSSTKSTTTTTASPATSTTIALPATGVAPEPAQPGATLAGAIPCPAEDGSSARTTSFTEAPPMCIATDHFLTATIATTAGTMSVQLNPSVAPTSVNDFVVLSRYHFYDGQPITNVASRASFTIGTAFSESTNAPGFAIPAERNAAGTVFTPGSLAIRPTTAVGTGAQLVVSTFEKAPDNSQDVNPLGIMLSGDALLSTIDGYASQSGQPTAPVTIITITVSTGGPIAK